MSIMDLYSYWTNTCYVFSYSESVSVTCPVLNELEWQVHMCNKLASRHIRVGLAAPTAVPKCDICENAPGGWLSASQ